MDMIKIQKGQVLGVARALAECTGNAQFREMGSGVAKPPVRRRAEAIFRNGGFSRQ